MLFAIISSNAKGLAKMSANRELRAVVALGAAVLLSMAACAATNARIGGVFPLLCTPYSEGGSQS